MNKEKKHFSILDIDPDVYEQNKLIAIKYFKDGKKPSFSMDIGEINTAGYGRLDSYGYFEYPLPINILNNDIDYEEIKNTDI